MVKRLLVLAVAIVAIAACSGTRQLYSQASTPVEFAKAVLLHHNAIGGEVAKLVADPAVSDATKARLREAYRVTVCSSSELAARTATADCDEGPAYKTDAAIEAYEAATNAQTAADVAAAAQAFVPLVTALVNVINAR
jgi:hypothetical protein